MTPKNADPNHPASRLRQQAEEKLRADGAQTPEPLPPGQMLHELRVHQIELEMQNEELRRAQAELEEARARYFDLYDLAPVGYLVLGEKGLILEANLTAASLLGVAHSALVKKHLTHFILPQYQDVYHHHRKQLFETGEPQVFTLKLMRAEASFWAEMEAVAAQSAKGAPICRMVIRDTTERKQADDALQKNEARYRVLTQTANDAIISADSAGNIVDWNHAAEKIFGYAEAEANGQPLTMIMPPRYYARHLAGMERMQTGGEKRIIGKSVEVVGQRKDGREFPLELSLSEWQTGSERYYTAIIRDISERKQAEETLRNERHLLRTLIDNIPDSIYTKDLACQKTLVNLTEMCYMGAKSEAEVLGKGDFELYPKELAEKFFADDQAVMQTGRPVLNKEEYVLDENGQKRWLLTSKLPLRDKNGQIVGLVGIGRDITERRQAEEQLKQSHDLLLNLARLVPGVIYQYRLYPDGSSAFPYSSPGMNDIYEVTPEDVQEDATPVFGRLHSDDYDRVANSIQESARTLQTFYCEFRVVLPRQGLRWRWSQAYPERMADGGTLWHGIISDITERKLAEQKLAQYSELLEEMVNERTRELREAQEQLVRQERLAVMGQLAGGVSHELRNPLSVIQNAVYYLKLVQPDVGDKIKRYHGIIEQEARTAEKIITDLLDFSRIKSVDVEPVAVSELLRQTLERYPVPPSVQVALEIPAGLPKVYVDPRHLTQVLGNLVTNACQAMVSTSSTSGVSTSSTSEVSTSEALPNLFDTPGGGKLSIFTTLQSDMICIHIQDTGAGITPENMKKLFEPLFTTKAKGIGLGLAVSRKLAEANGGRIEVESVVGKGSTFTVYLPIHVVVPVPARDEVVPVPAPPKSMGAGGNEVVPVPAPPKSMGAGGDEVVPVPAPPKSMGAGGNEVVPVPAYHPESLAGPPKSMGAGGDVEAK